MDRAQYEALVTTAPPTAPVVTLDDLSDWTERTLLYGYTAERDTFHVYLSGGVIFVHIYTGTRDSVRTLSRRAESSWPVGLLHPTKRVYPESSDFEFLKLLQERGAEVSLRPFDDERAVRVAGLTFHGAL